MRVPTPGTIAARGRQMALSCKQCQRNGADREQRVDRGPPHAWTWRVQARRPQAAARVPVWRSVVGAEPVDAVPQPGRVLNDLRDAHDRYGVFERDLAAVDLLQEVDRLVDAPELRIVVLDVTRRELLNA